MGLIKSLINATSGSLGDQFKEFINCPSISSNVLVQRGTVNHGSGNTNPTPGVISNGSTIAVPQGMAMMIIENGAIKEFTAEPGTYTWDTSSEPSIFTGGLGAGIVNTFKTIGSRFTYGGLAAKDQRVYYVNLLVIPGNKFGSPQPKKITDEKYGMLEVTFNGEYVFKVADPIVLVNQLIGANPKDTITYEEVIGSQIKAKFIEQLTKAISIVMRKNKVSFGDMGMYGSDLSNEINNGMDAPLRTLYGIEITDVSLADVNVTEESMARISKIDDATIFSNASLQSGLMATASAEALTKAASNEAGAMMGFMGVNMATNAGATMMGAVNQNQVQGQQQPFTSNNIVEPGTIFGNNNVQSTEQPVANEQQASATAPVQENISTKKCSKCGSEMTGMFCGECGNKEEEVKQVKKCSNCGKESQGAAKFCTQCGTPLL